jgi:hypothetical protein
MGDIGAGIVDCRSQTCRVELHDDGTGRLRRSLMTLAHQLSETLPTFTANTLPRPKGGSKLGRLIMCWRPMFAD